MLRENRHFTLNQYKTIVAGLSIRELVYYPARSVSAALF
jgi:hypothetical protein